MSSLMSAGNNVGFGGDEPMKEAKKPPPARASPRKGCMKGKGGPQNASCTFKGVRQRTWGSWVSEIREPKCNDRIWLGTYNTAREAALAYDNEARRLYGPNAQVNLPDEVAQEPPQRLTRRTRASRRATSRLSHAARKEKYHQHGMKIKMKQVAAKQRQMEMYLMMINQQRLNNQFQGGMINQQRKNNQIHGGMINQQQMNNQIQGGMINQQRINNRIQGGMINQQRMNNQIQGGMITGVVANSVVNHLTGKLNHKEGVGESMCFKSPFKINLNVNLPEFDDSDMWVEAASTMDYMTQAFCDPGIAASVLGDDIGIDLKHPLLV